MWISVVVVIIIIIIIIIWRYLSYLHLVILQMQTDRGSARNTKSQALFK